MPADALAQSADAPLVAGVSGGVGTTSLAAALRAQDGGVHRGERVQVLVCRATTESLLRAATAIGRMPGQPILAVNAVDGARPGRAVTARMTLIAPYTARTVLLPHVARWRELPRPIDDIRTLTTAARRDLDRSSRRWLDAVDQIAGAAPTTPRAASTIVPMVGHILHPERAR